MSRSTVSARLVELVGRRMALLADPVRIQLIFALQDGEVCVTALAERLGREPRVISHHLGALYGEGVLERRKEGTSVFYRLADFSACQVLVLAGEGVAARIEELGEMVGERRPPQWFT